MKDSSSQTDEENDMYPGTILAKVVSIQGIKTAYQHHGQYCQDHRCIYMPQAMIKISLCPPNFKNGDDITSYQNERCIILIDWFHALHS